MQRLQNSIRHAWSKGTTLATKGFLICAFIATPIFAWVAAIYIAGNVFHQGLGTMTLADIGRALASIVVFLVVLLGAWYGLGNMWDELSKDTPEKHI